VREWSAEVVVDAGLASRLIAGQFPDLDLGSLSLLGEGWDNTVWLVDEQWVFRFPRREIAVPAVERQLAVLPELSPLVPLPIPRPIFSGLPDEGYPWPFFGTAFLPGRELAGAGLDAAARAGLARPLGGFLRALHAAEVPGAGALPVDPFGRTDTARRVPRARSRLAEIAELGLWEAPEELDDLFDSGLQLPPPRRLAVVHGDLHFRHLLVDGDGSPTAVIDWDDLCRADPSIDLPLVWSLLPPDARPDFLTAYGGADDEQLLRSRVLAVSLCAALAAYAHHEGLDNVEREAVAGLERAATG
jgi:aminoglycoside phosphotransferase (APT) family kinase protein